MYDGEKQEVIDFLISVSFLFNAQYTRVLIYVKLFLNTTGFNHPRFGVVITGTYWFHLCHIFLKSY